MTNFSFDSTIVNLERSIAKDLKLFNENRLNESDYIELNEIFRVSLLTWIAKYSNNNDLTFLKNEFKLVSQKLNLCWTKKYMKVYVGYEQKEFNQFHYNSYVNLLWFFSISILLDYNQGKEISYEIIKKCDVKDLVFNYFIKKSLDEEFDLFGESYQRFFMIPEKFKRLREIILENDILKCKTMIEIYLKKYWLKSYNRYGSDTGLANFKTIAGGKYFFGFWAFEVAAVAKLKGFEEQEFRHLPYFPTFKDR